MLHAPSSRFDSKLSLNALHSQIGLLGARVRRPPFRPLLLSVSHNCD